MSSYDLYAPGWAMAPDWEFKGQDENPQAAGEFVWTGFDYIGEPTPYNSDMTILTNFSDPVERAKAEKQLAELGRIPTPSRSSYFGIIDLAGFPKDRYYLYQARWRSDLPMAHILPHWTWPERKGEVTPVHVYTSGDAAELFVNGVSQGLRTKLTQDKAPRLAEITRQPELVKDIYRLCWDDVVYQPGEVKVVSYKDGKVWATDSVQTAGAPAQIQLTVDDANDAVGKLSVPTQHLIFVSVSLTDKKGIFAPRADNLIQFKVEGAAVIEATDNGDPTSHVAFTSHERKAFNGRALVILRPTGQPGSIRLTATSKGLTTQKLTLTAQ
jgi:beta-galactosidase